jgi:hypothetical protein
MQQTTITAESYGLDSHKQDFGLVEIVTVTPNPRSTDTVTFRIKLKLDGSYIGQSHATIETWRATVGWVEVHTIPSLSMDIPGLVSGAPRPERITRAQAVRDLRAELLRVATAVVG